VEKKLWNFLRDRRLLGSKFRRQHPIGKYVVDFCCLEKKAVIELDGGQHARQNANDFSRTRDIEKEGFQVVRFWNNQITENPQGVLERIAFVLKSPHLNPLPDGERK
jgi:very-short-patch-repair endonuclease